MRVLEREMSMSKNEKAIHACRILNFMVGDLVSAMQMRELFLSESMAKLVGGEAIGCANRICLSYLILTLDKWAEFYNRFHKVIPDDCRAGCKLLLQEIRRRRVKDFRNKFVAHIWDKDRRRPLTSAELEELAQVAFDSDEKAFSLWCNNPDGNEFPATVLSVVEHTRDRIREDYKLQKDEILEGVEKPTEAPTQE